MIKKCVSVANIIFDPLQTCAVDLFSLGCLFYYVLSKGLHPFGDNLRRQANILGGDYNLEDIQGEERQIILQKLLIGAMISSKPLERPSCTAILKHPMFWDNSKILAFFQVLDPALTTFFSQCLLGCQRQGREGRKR